MVEPKALVVGDLEIARRTCLALRSRGHHVTHLFKPTDDELGAALSRGVNAVAILVRGDVVALRYALLAEYLLPNVRLVVTLFDRTVSDQLVHAVPNCRVTSPADVAVPSIVGACLGRDILALEQEGDRKTAIMWGPTGELRVRWTRDEPRVRSVLNQLATQMRPHDVTTRILLSGISGLLVLLGTDWILGWAVRGEQPAVALYDATRVVSTVGPGSTTTSLSGLYLVYSSVAMLLTIGLTALFTAGAVNRLRSTRSVGLIGRRTLPKRGHVVVIGLGQVGLRLCTQLRQLGIRVVAVERDPRASNLRLAKEARVPVLVGHAEDRAVLRKLSLHRARALAAMGADDLDNVEIAIAALAVCPSIRVVLRAGESEIIAETRSLFHIGEVRDVSALTTSAVTRSMCGEAWQVAYPHPQLADGAVGRAPEEGKPSDAPQTRCSCP